ncbi:MAG TPA: OmpA family protein [bacterium]|nr:OmpA family protein [bacterium]
MSTKNLPGLVVLALLVLAGSAPARFNSPTLLYETPTADVLPARTFAVSADLTGPLLKTDMNANYPEVDANVRFSPVRHLDFALTAYTFADYVLDAKYQIIGGDPNRFGLALGVLDVGLHGDISPIGHDTANAWPDWKYNRALPQYDRQPENFSAYAVTSIPVSSILRIHVGLGRGRFVGYSERSKYFNTGVFSSKGHSWDFALFGGGEVWVSPKVALVLEGSSRDLNSGVKAKFGPVCANIAWNKMEGLLFGQDEGRFGRFELGATYEFSPWAQPKAPTPPTRPQPLPPTPPPETLPPIAPVIRLYPIWFMWDKSDITEVAAATLRRNADVILSHPNIKSVTLLGYASEEGTIEHNRPLSERRANAALAYLKSLGVPADKLSSRGMGVSTGRPLPMHRSVYFQLELEQ